MMSKFRRTGNRFSIRLPTDADGYLGRHCPDTGCDGYFKIRLGTGIADSQRCCCPYCGHLGDSDEYNTSDQIEYAKSVALREIIGDITKDFKKLEFDHRPSGGFGVGVSVKVEPGQPLRLHRYAEKQLETDVQCGNCTLDYAVYGVFAYCPDCGMHNSVQQFMQSIGIVVKTLDLSATLEDEQVRRQFIDNALEDCVSVFDGCGRALIAANAQKATDPNGAANLSFQNLDGAQKNLLRLFGIDLSAGVSASDWENVNRAFQKRHILQHKMGVADAAYVKKANDPSAIEGRKIQVSESEVRALTPLIEKLAQHLSLELQKLP